MKKVLITGAGGFIGSHLAEEFRKYDYKVRCLLMENEDSKFLESIGCEIVYGDIRDKDSIERAIDGVDLVYHLAALPRFDATIPEEEYYRVNVYAVKNMLEICRLKNVETFIYVSSIEGRGITVDGKALTEDSPSNPRNIYGKTKYLGEIVCKSYFLKYQMDVRIVIPPTTYGPREYLILQRIFKPVSKGFFVLFGKGDALIEFCYVKNMVKGMFLVYKKGEKGESYIISDLSPYPFKKVIQEIGKQSGKKLFLVKIPVPIAYIIAFMFEVLSKVFRFYPFYVKATGRPPFSRATLQWAVKSAIFCDISKAVKELGYQPDFSLEEGLKETILWYKKNNLL